ncbi:MAG TPA: hypothetical protein VM120_12870 [Bryobacteraceae bacterium]|nr:hypothetical protein [Bryobacteraceae bacterium]
MRRLMLVALAASFVAGCNKPKRVRAGALDEDDSALRSMVHVADDKSFLQLGNGFHALEGNAWRWTKGRFSVTLRPPLNAEKDGAYLVLRFSLAESVVSRVHSVRLAANVNGTPVEGQTYTKNGDYIYRRHVPASALKGGAVTAEFSLDHYLQAGQLEGRELGLIVSVIGLEAVH